MDIDLIPYSEENIVVHDDDGALTLSDCGSARGDGFIVYLWDELGGEKGLQFLTRENLEALVARGQALLASDWATGENAAK